MQHIYTNEFPLVRDVKQIFFLISGAIRKYSWSAKTLVIYFYLLREGLGVTMQDMGRQKFV